MARQRICLDMAQPENHMHHRRVYCWCCVGTKLCSKWCCGCCYFKFDTIVLMQNKMVDSFDRNIELHMYTQHAFGKSSWIRCCEWLVVVMCFILLRCTKSTVISTNNTKTSRKQCIHWTIVVQRAWCWIASFRIVNGLCFS